MVAGTVTGDASIGTDTLISIESVRGTNFNDTYVATGFNGGSAEFRLEQPLTNLRGWMETTSSPAMTTLAFRIRRLGRGDRKLERFWFRQAQSTAAGDVAGVGVDTFTGISAARGSNSNNTFIVAVDNTPITIDGRNGSDTVNYDTPPPPPPPPPPELPGPHFGQLGSGHGERRRVNRNRHAAIDRNVFGTNASDTYDASNFSSSSNNAGSIGTFNVFVGGGGNDTITGNGNTQVQYFNATSGVLITLGANGSGSASGDSSVGSDTFVAGVDNVLGSNFNDTYNASAFTSSSGPFNQFQGLGGNNTITGNGSTQLYYAGSTAGISVTLNAGGAGTVTGNPRSARIR